jgi:hypothetical protein
MILGRFFEKYSNIKFHENRSGGAEMFHADGRPDMTVAFRYFAKAPKNDFIMISNDFFFPSEMEFLYHSIFSKQWIRLFNILYINNFEHFMEQKIS